MAHVKLTDRTIQSLQTAHSQEDFFDSTFTHGGSFGVRVSKAGRKVFFVFYRIYGHKKRFNLGSYPGLSLAEARKRAIQILAKVGDGEDPAEEKTRTKKAETFEELAEVYLRNHENKLAVSSLRDFQGMLKRDVLPRFGSRKAMFITKADIIAMLDDIACGRGRPIMANRTLELVRRIFNYAISRDLIQTNPAQGIEKPGTERKGERVLSQDEIKLFWEVTEEEEPMIRALYRLLLLTGTRPKEVKAMEWSHIDNEIWTIPGANSKNRRKHQLYLTDLARDEIHMLKQFPNGSDFVFPGLRPDDHLKEFREGHLRLLDHMAGERWTPRDLRRTVQTRMSEIGIRPDIVDRVLNHNVPGVRAHYDHYNYFPEIRNALMAWARKVESIVRGDSVKKVVNLFG